MNDEIDIEKDFKFYASIRGIFTKVILSINKKPLS